MSCNCPKGEELYAIVRENIEKSGFHIMYIFDHEDPRKTFFYTIGLKELGLPELFMSVNCRPEVGARVIHNVVNHINENGVVYGRNDDILHGMDISLVRVDTDSALDNYMFQLEGYYGDRNANVAQILMPDENGKLPGEVGYDMPQMIIEEVIFNA